MGAGKVARAKLISLLPRGAQCIPVLTVEEPARGCLDQKRIGIVAVGCYIGVEAFISELREQQGVRTRCVPVLDGGHVAALMEIRRRTLRIERVQSEVIESLRI